MTVENETAESSLTILIDRYLHLTRTVMPQMACRPENRWPVRNDHCFQRIVLDNVTGGVWYDHINRPAYKNLCLDQARQAVMISEGIISGEICLRELNRKSLTWRGKQ